MKSLIQVHSVIEDGGDIKIQSSSNLAIHHFKMKDSAGQIVVDKVLTSTEIGHLIQALNEYEQRWIKIHSANPNKK